jgi:dipeptidyl aminopeptidase/acylaminoacyl peptidase
MDDAQLSWAAKSKDTDRVVFVRQTFADSPMALLTNMEFAAAKPVQATNANQDDYTWGRAELVNYTVMGQPLQGTLIYPADWEQGKTYPMVTYIYERLSDGFHQYQYPSNTSPYNQQHFSQSGYFVFMPDIVYEDRQPGVSAVKCIEAAVKAALAKGVGIDPKKIGLTGHSWGGYETVFTATKSKMFAAYVAGAPLTELISMYSSFYWNWGQTNQVIFEVSQGRMHVPFWEDMRAYIDNSPLFHAQDITAPMMVEVGTVDGAVDWHQGQYLYNTLRRMGKNMVMLVYANENHGLAQPANMKDYAMRARHFFDVYLKGETPQKWVKEGVPFIRLGEELKPKEQTGGGKG